MGWLLNISRWLLILSSLVLISRINGVLSFHLPSNCTKSCGNISIEYPFGIENGCFRSHGFNLSCINDRTTNFTPTLFLDDGRTKIRQINKEKRILYIDLPIITMDVDEDYLNSTIIDLKNLPYSFFNLPLSDGAYDYYGVTTRNKIYALGCSAIGNLVNLMTNNTYINKCLTTCSTNNRSQEGFSDGSCLPNMDLFKTVFLGIQLVRLNKTELHMVNASTIKVCMLDEEYAPSINDNDIEESITKGNCTASLSWYINDDYGHHPTCEEAKKNKSTYACSSNALCYNAYYNIDPYGNSTSIGYICQCSSGYYGNPYLPNGCQVSDNFTLSPKKECAKSCGSMDIPFPFGLEKGCYRDDYFNLTCNHSTKPPTIILSDSQFIVKNISLEDGRLEVETRDNYPIYISDIFLSDGHKLIFKWIIAHQNCETAKINKTTYACFDKFSECVEVNKTDSSGYLNNGYRCKCKKGYKGNPYLAGGCTDIDECVDPIKYVCEGTCKNTEGGYTCIPKKNSLLIGAIAGISASAGLLIICTIIFILRRKFRKRYQEKMKEKYFHQNHGLLLKQLISSGENTAERTNIFTLKEIEKATDNFDETRVLGHGGHGTVYKGILSDQRVVAIKKSKIVKKSEIDQFINEVAVLSQINHRHVVKLFGCCLETEVPLLIYEFISNGALSDHLHVTDEKSTLAWEDRLRIATEASGALAYLHSAASISILHRDIKSSNILLDDHFTAKVSDFGASRFIPLDQTHVITAVQGTFGYLDPEYYQSSQLTEKSDVYSFGVILLELLTGRKPLYTIEEEPGLNLTMHFLQAMKANRSFDLVEDRVMEESNKEELDEIFQLIQMCLKLKGVDRPTMKEVEYKLQSLRKRRMKKRGYCISEGDEEAEYLLGDSIYPSSESGTSRNYSLEKEVLCTQRYPR